MDLLFSNGVQLDLFANLLFHAQSSFTIYMANSPRNINAPPHLMSSFHKRYGKLLTSSIIVPPLLLLSYSVILLLQWLSSI